MITHRKITQLRLQRASQPQAPFWQAMTVAPYGSGRGEPIAVNYLTLTATSKPKSEISVTRSVTDQLERERHLEGPALVEASDVSELIFRRGEDAVRRLTDQEIATLCLLSSNGCVPPIESPSFLTIAVSCWPLNLGDIERMFAKCQTRRLRWGALLPLLHPVTTSEETIVVLADLASQYRASFFAPVSIESDPQARHALASMGDLDEDEVAELFDSDLEPLVTRAERVAARHAWDRGMLDHVPTLAPLTSNWTSAMKLSLAGTRMIRMGRDVESGWALHRSSQLVAKLHKPVERIAAAASLSIVEALDSTSIEALEQWLRDGRSDIFEKIDAEWRGS